MFVKQWSEVTFNTEFENVAVCWHVKYGMQICCMTVNVVYALVKILAFGYSSFFM